VDTRHYGAIVPRDQSLFDLVYLFHSPECLGSMGFNHTVVEPKSLGVGFSHSQGDKTQGTHARTPGNAVTLHAAAKQVGLTRLGRPP
jgi:hypothetical protein